MHEEAGCLGIVTADHMYWSWRGPTRELRQLLTQRGGFIGLVDVN